MLFDLGGDARTRRFVLAVLVAFLPAAVIGAVAHKYIKEYLFESPTLVCTTLIVGGVILLAVDKMRLETRYHDAMDFSLPMALAIGFAQCLAMIPGVSRSGSSIVGAFAYDLYKNYASLTFSDVQSIALGFVVAFISGVVVVRHLLAFVSGHGFALFAWWRIVVGGMGLGALAVLG
jgi:undecaprenyl-diphosphatase